MSRFVTSLLWLAVLTLGYRTYTQYQELRLFKSTVLEQTQKHLEQSKAMEYEIKNALFEATQKARLEASNINGRFDALLRERERVHGSAPNGNQSVPNTAATESGVEHSASVESSRASGAISRKLLKCEARLLYEAKEYDILATHYRVLLQTYEQARLANGTKTKKEQSQKN